MRQPPPSLNRRAAIAAAGGAIAAIAVGPSTTLGTAAGAARARLKQSVSRWPFATIPLRDFCRAARDMGLEGIDLLGRDDWELVREYGLVCSMGYPTNRRDFIATGFNDPANHPLLLRELESAIPAAARQGVPNVIAMFGNRRGRSDEDGAAHCAGGLRRIAPLAEEHGITVCVELLNSKVDHADYQGDRTAFGVRVVDAVASPRVRLLYDIYHMQIMEGDVIRTIREHRSRIAHYHTGGVPGRHELDDTQELNYRAVARAIAETQFSGFVAHEFIPTREPLAALRQAVEVFRV